ncbi:MAG: FtsX-like permease family protein [Bacteroidales bacterium]|nr:FtsX-like permease family protein [Bacteroidales bacterium]
MKIALKNFLMTLKRYKVASFLNIAGLTIAFAAFYVIASQVIYSLTYNRSLKDSNRTYYVSAFQKWNDHWSLNCPNPLCYEVADIMPEVEAIASMNPYYFPANVYAKANGYDFEKFPYGITNCNFSITDVFDFKILSGNIQDFNVSDAIIISESAAKMMNVEVGSMIYTEGGERMDNGIPENPFNVVAIFEDFEDNTSLSSRHIFLNDERKDGMTNNNWNYRVIVRLSDEMSEEKFVDLWQKKYADWYVDMTREYIEQFGTEEEKADYEEKIGNMKDERGYVVDEMMAVPIRLVSFDELYFETEFSGNSMSQTLVMIAIALVIVVVAFINFVNFFMSLVPVRMKAVNICKVYGADQGTLRWNFIFEAIGLVLIALLLALYIVFAMQNSFVSNYVTCSLALSDNIFTIIIVAFIAVMIAVVSAVYPAFYITKFNASLAVKGGFAYSESGRLLRSGLVSVQYIVSMILIIVTAVFFLQYRYMIRYDLGVDKENVYVFSTDIPAHQGETFIQKLESHSQIKEVTASLSSFFGSYSSINGRINGDDVYLINVWYVRHNLPDFFRIPIIHGEGLRNINDVLINSYVNKGVGIDIGYFIDEGCEVKGIIENVYNLSLKDGHVNSAYYCSDNYNSFYFRTHENADIEDICDYVTKCVKEVAPNAYEPDVQILDENIKRIYGDVKKQIVLIGIFALIAIVISLMGIFGIVLFETQHRRREIGIRKVYGATTDKIITMFVRRYAVIVGICFVVAAPIAWTITSRWLEQFANRITMPLWIYLVVLLLIMTITVLIVALRSWKAANENPVEAI